MEMKSFFASLTLILMLTSCSNAPEFQTGEIRTLQLLKQAFEPSTNPDVLIDARTLLSRKQIDAANTPVLFVELQSGQNGTLTPYPGQGVAQTWLGADGATITLERGILKASRGMGNDLIGSNFSLLPWSELSTKVTTYSRTVMHISGNNTISKRVFECSIKKYHGKKLIEIWGLEFRIKEFKENCSNNGFKIENIYYVDNQNIVRKSSQFHSETVGYIITERIDR